MKKIKITTVLRSAVIPFFLFTASCLMPGEPVNTSSNTTTVNTTNSSANNGGNFANSQNAAPPINPGNVAADSNPANQGTANSLNTSKGNSSQGNNSSFPSTPTPAPIASATATPTTTDPNDSKKEEGVFSFPPPRSTTFVSLKPIATPERPQISLDEYIRRIKESLSKAGYGEDRMKYFSHRREFALVTHFERIDADGKPFERDRWIELVPAARNVSEYFKYLFYGKRTLYRVTAIIVTDESIRPKNGQAPDFDTAKKWFETGELVTDNVIVGGQTPQAFMLDQKFRAYVLIYNFEKHIGEGKAKFMNEFLSAEDQLKNSGIVF